MRLKKSAHGRDIINDIMPEGLSIRETIDELKRKKWNTNRIVKKAKMTYDDCNLALVLDELCICEEDEDIIKVIKRNILKLFDDQVGKRYACVYLVAYAKSISPDVDIRSTIKELLKTTKINHPMQIKKIIDSAISDGKYLGLLYSDGSISNHPFFRDWGYYYENKNLNEILIRCKNSMLNDDDKKWYDVAYRNRHQINYRIMNGEGLNFSQPTIKRKKIKKDGKIREVYEVDKKSNEYIALKYLKKKIDIEFSIKYANRNKITRQLFALIENIEILASYTIFRFDIKDFFNSTDASSIYDKYIENSNLDGFLKLLLQELLKNYDKCYLGLATSNALIEIAGKEFDDHLKSMLNSYGLIFYSRYVDDGLIILNRNIDKDLIEKMVIETISISFGECVVLHPTKINYLQKIDSDGAFDYLGYFFTKKNRAFSFGITREKRNKYCKILDQIVDDYITNMNVELLRQRVKYFISRTVYYNNFRYGSNLGSWDVTGISANYCLLKNAILNNILENETEKFLKNIVKNKIYTKLNKIGFRYPYVYFISGKNYETYSIYDSIKNNKSIVFHPNIGWSTQYLYKQLRKLGYEGKLKGKSYRECVALYFSIIKLQ